MGSSPTPGAHISRVLVRLVLIDTKNTFLTLDKSMEEILQNDQKLKIANKTEPLSKMILNFQKLD